MFLTKKNAHLVNKGKTVPNKRPLGGTYSLTQDGKTMSKLYLTNRLNLKLFMLLLNK